MRSINGKKYSQDPTPIPLRYGEKTRITLVNDMMMNHPMHLHGMFMVLENGSGAYNPYKHTILVKACERLSFYAPGGRFPRKISNNPSRGGATASRMRDARNIAETWTL